MAIDAARLAAALPGYDIGEELGRGAFGVVVAGNQRALGRQVAIKALPAFLAGDEGQRRRFTAEARLVASLDHPHVVRVFDYVEEDDLFLLVMELLPGGNLDERVDQRPVGPEEACAVLLSTAGALHYAHRQGILHRDVKPANVMFAADGTVKLGDFGIAKVLQSGDGLTATGSVMGTPAYMAPEQATASELGPPTDIYAAGVMLYQLLSGRLPFDTGGEAIAQLYQHVNQAPRPLAEAAPDVPAPLSAVVHRALEKDPADRYADAEAFGVAIAEAATAAFGRGWLGDTGVPVLTSGDISGALERFAPDPEATVTVAPVPVPADPPAAPDVVSAAPRRSRRRPLTVAAVAVIAILGIGAFVLLSPGGDDGGSSGRDEAAPSTTRLPTSSSTPGLTQAALGRFTRECRAQGVPPEQCRCVSDAAVSADLAPDDFDAAVDQLRDDGSLVNGLADLFEQCA